MLATPGTPATPQPRVRPVQATVVRPVKQLGLVTADMDQRMTPVMPGTLAPAPLTRASLDQWRRRREGRRMMVARLMLRMSSMN